MKQDAYSIGDKSVKSVCLLLSSHQPENAKSLLVNHTQLKAAPNAIMAGPSRMEYATTEIALELQTTNAHNADQDSDLELKDVSEKQLCSNALAVHLDIDSKAEDVC